jgi:hypothetical protein
LADLSAASVRLRPFEAVTLVRELVLKVARGEVAGVPSSHVIRLSASGAISVEGPVAAGGRPVMRAAQLLESLLPSSSPGHQFHVPGSLKLVVARALGTLDLPPFPSLEAFAEALGRFAATDPRAMVANLVMAWADSSSRAAGGSGDQATEEASATNVEPFLALRGLDLRGPSAASTLTVSDIRRARRATGMPLAQVAERSRIPVGLLRQLEWGYLFHWPGGFYGRTQLIRYARAAGLDEQLVISTVEPLIADAESRRELVVTTPAPVPAPAASVSAPTTPAPISAAPAAAGPTRPIVDVQDLPLVLPAARPLAWRGLGDSAGSAPRARTKALAALAIPALLAIGLLPAWWEYSKQVSGPTVATQAPADAGSGGRAPVPADAAASGLRGTQDAPQPAPSLPDGAAASDAPLADARASAEAPAPGASNDAPVYRLAADSATPAPSFASVGTAMFFSPASTEGGERPAVMSGGDSREAVLRITRIVDDGANNFHVRLSPDGERIAFDSDRGGQRGVYIADAKGNNVRRVSPDGFAAVPSWSPDSSTLAFSRAEPDRPHVWNLWTLDLATGELTKVTNHASGQPWGASWFPGGYRLAYSIEDRLIVRNLQDGTERTYESPRKGRQLRAPTVSPDGRHLVFNVEGEGVWLLNLGDGSMRRLLEDATATEFTWAPDGRRLAYYSGRSDAWNVWVMAPR